MRLANRLMRDDSVDRYDDVLGGLSHQHVEEHRRAILHIAQFVGLLCVQENDVRLYRRHLEKATFARRGLDRLMPQLTDTVRSIRALTDLLSRHPEALIRGRTNTGKE